MSKPLPWFRFYTEALNDPKVQSLPPDLFKAWVNILCLFAQSSDEFLPKVEDISFGIHFTKSKTSRIISTLVERGLLDCDSENRLFPHNWDERQYKSDGSTDRVKRFRQRFRNVSGNVSETAPDTDTDTDTEENTIPQATRARGHAPNLHHLNPIPPTLEDVIAHGIRSGVSQEMCEQFHRHYQSQGWVKGNGQPIADWCPLLVNWKITESKNAKQGPNNGTPTQPHKRGIDQPRRTPQETAEQYAHSLEIARRAGLPER